MREDLARREAVGCNVSEPARLLVAVSAYGSTAVVVDVWGEAAEAEISEIGVDLDEHPLECPEEHGLHVWEGKITHSPVGSDVFEGYEASWSGEWRPLSGDEWARLMLGRPAWGEAGSR